MHEDFPPDMYVLHDRETAPAADLKFIGAARNHMPRLIETKRAPLGAASL